MTDKKESAAKKLRLAFDMHETGVVLKREQIRRRHPELDTTEIDKILNTWLADKKE